VSRRQANPLRPLTQDERDALTRLRRATAAPAAQVIRAPLLLAVADGANYRMPLNSTAAKAATPSLPWSPASTSTAWRLCRHALAIHTQESYLT
jgi:hypothetical protein